MPRVKKPKRTILSTIKQWWVAVVCVLLICNAVHQQLKINHLEDISDGLVNIVTRMMLAPAPRPNRNSI